MNSSTRRFFRLAGLLAALTPAMAGNALERWRPHYETLHHLDPELRRQIVSLETPSRHEILDTSPAGGLSALHPLIDTFALEPGDSITFPPMHGPETPFPDHAPLADVARLRLALLKLAWIHNDHPRAVALAEENLDLARAALHAQEGIIPVIAATGLWQSALDGVYWLARQPALNADQATALQARLAADDQLAPRAIERAFAGEYTFVQQVVIDRLPVTNDPELILDSIGSLGMSPPQAPAEGEPRLPVTDRAPLDPAATRALSSALVEDYRRALNATPTRHPLPVWRDRHAPAQRELAAELGAFLRYAVADEAPTPERIAAAAEVLATVENPAGKLYVLIATPHWNAISETVFRRQAQNRALQVLLAWRRLGHAADADTLQAAGLLAELPPDPFAADALRIDAARARVWSTGPDGVDNGGHGNGDGENLGRPDDLVWPATLATATQENLPE